MLATGSLKSRKFHFKEMKPSAHLGVWTCGTPTLVEGSPDRCLRAWSDGHLREDRQREGGRLSRKVYISGQTTPYRAAHVLYNTYATASMNLRGLDANGELVTTDSRKLEGHARPEAGWDIRPEECIFRGEVSPLARSDAN